MPTIRLGLTPDGNPPLTYEIGTLTRLIADLFPEEIGLTLDDGQQLLRPIWVQIIGGQARAYALCRRGHLHQVSSNGSWRVSISRAPV